MNNEKYQLAVTLNLIQGLTSREVAILKKNFIPAFYFVLVLMITSP